MMPRVRIVLGPLGEKKRADVKALPRDVETRGDGLRVAGHAGSRPEGVGATHAIDAGARWPSGDM